MVIYLLVGVDIIIYWFILLVLCLLVPVMVLEGIFGLAFGASHGFSLVSHRQCQMMMSRKDNNFEFGNLTTKLECGHLEIPKKEVNELPKVFSMRPL